MTSEFEHRFIPGKIPLTLLTLHDRQGDENDLPPVGRALAPGAAVLSPRLQSGWSDEREIARLADWIAGATVQYGLDAGKLFALGYADGADTAASLLLLRPGTIAGGILLRPAKALCKDPLPNLLGAPVLIAAGEEDALVSVAQSENLARLLRDAGAKVDLAVQNTGHELTPQDFALGKQWFSRFLPGALSSG